MAANPKKRAAPHRRRQRLLRQLYDGEVAQADRYAGELLDHLRDAGIYEEALIVVTADHGEEHWDHGGYQHGHTLHDEVLRVPLIVKLPGNRGAGRRVEGPVSLLDIGPTITEITGVRWRGKVEGRCLLDLLEPGPGATEERALYAESIARGAEQRSIILWPHKLMWTPDDERWEMYDLSQDAGERNNLAAADEASLASLKESLETWVRAASAREPATQPPRSEVDEATKERLRALGYAE